MTLTTVQHRAGTSAPVSAAAHAGSGTATTPGAGDPPPAPGRGTGHGRPARRSTRGSRGPRRRLAVPIALQIGAMLGIGALCYAPAADWFATLNHNAEVSGYVEAVEALPAADREAKLEIARDYNEHMPQGPLLDPYSVADDESAAQHEADSAYAAYEQVLRVSDNGVIGELLYPRLDIGLPVYHGTSDKVISKGVGHLYGSSLPVGGPSTHSVLTSHSGLVNASLFTPLPGAELGDEFQVTVLGETHYYRVDRIETVLPEETESLRIVDGDDQVTLITCTPIGINSHRLLVTGVRIPPPEGSGGSAVAGDGKHAGFPWWAVAFIGGSAGAAYLLFVPPRRRSRDGRTAHRKNVGGRSYTADTRTTDPAAPRHDTDTEATA